LVGQSTRRRQPRQDAAGRTKDRLQAKSIIEAMFANRQQADLASAFMDAWDRGEHWRAAIRTSIATYEDDFQKLFRAELAKGVTELGPDPTDYDLVNPNA